MNPLKIKKVLFLLSVAFYLSLVNTALALDIYPQVSANILFIAPVDSKVNKGDILVQFDDRIAKQQLGRALVILKLKQQLSADKKLDLEQITTLFDNLVRSKRELELAQIAYKTAQYEQQAQNYLVELRKLDLEKYTIRSPFDVIVTQTPHLRNVSNHYQPQVLMHVSKNVKSKP